MNKLYRLNLPVSGTTFILLLLFLDVHNPKTAFMDGIRAIDWLGSLSILAVTLMILLGLDFGGETFPWSSPKVVCLLVFGVLMVGFFVLSEKKLARYPLMPLKLFAERGNVATLVVTACHGMVRFLRRPFPSRFVSLIIFAGCPSSNAFIGLYWRRILPPSLLPIDTSNRSHHFWSPISTLHGYGSTLRYLLRYNDASIRRLSRTHLGWMLFHDIGYRSLHGS